MRGVSRLPKRKSRFLLDATPSRSARGPSRHRRLACEPLEDRHLLSVWTVANMADSGDGSLRQAIADATSGDTIQFANGLTGDVSLHSTLAISKNLTINGPGASVWGNNPDLTITRDDTSYSGRLIDVGDGFSVALSGLTFANGGGATRGGAICTAGTEGLLTIEDCWFEGNSATDEGGAVYVEGQLHISGCTFQSNSVTGVGGIGGAVYASVAATIDQGSVLDGNSAWKGAAVYAAETLTLNDTYLTDNTSPDDFLGAAAYCDGQLTVDRCHFDGDTGGALCGNATQVGHSYFGNCERNTILTHGSTTVQDSIFDGKQGWWDIIQCDSQGGSLTVGNCEFTGNTPDSGSDAIDAPHVGTITVDNCTFTNDTCHLVSGGEGSIINVFDCTITGCSSQGGGSLLGTGPSSTTTLNGCTLSDNDGVVCNYGTLSIINCTITGNETDATGPGLSLIENTGTLSVCNSTIADNVAPAIENCEYGNLTLSNTIVANKQGYDDIITDNESDTITANSCLIGKVGTRIQINGAGNIIGQDPMLSTLGDHGGPTQTMTLLEGSPAIDAGNSDYDYSSDMTDQRGLPRINNNKVDIGAVEDQTASVLITAPNPVLGTLAFLSALCVNDLTDETYTYSWTVTSAPSGASPELFTGNAASTWVEFSAAGSYSFQVAARGSGGTTLVNNVSLDVVSSLATIVVTPERVVLDADATQQFAAVGYDQFNHAISDLSFTWTTTVGEITQDGLLTAPSTWEFGTVTATAGSVSGTSYATVDLMDIVEWPAATPNPVTTAETQLSVLAASPHHPESDLTYTWTVKTLPEGVASPDFSINNSNPAKNTTATFHAPGEYVFTITADDHDGLSARTDLTVIVLQTATTVVVSPSPADVDVNQTRQFTAVARDQFGVAMTGVDFSWESTIGTIDEDGLLTAPASAGSGTVTAHADDSDTVYGSSAVTINSSLVIADAAAASPNPTTETTNLSVLAHDDAYSEASLTYTWIVAAKPEGATSPDFSVNESNAAKNTTVTFHSAGQYTFLVTATTPDDREVTSQVVVTVNPDLTTIMVSPGSAAVAVGGTQQFTAVGYDQFGAEMPDQTFTWTTTLGEISTSGLWTAPSNLGIGSVTATVGLISGSGHVTAGSLTIVDGPAAASDPVTTAETELSSLAADPVYAETALTYTWTVKDMPDGIASPTFSANGNNLAKNSTVTFSAPGEYVFTVTVTNPEAESVSADVTVTVEQTATTVVVSPASAAMNINQTRQFTATAFDQFDAAMVGIDFTWESTIGSIDQNGLLTAPATLGSGTVTAHASGSHPVSGSSSVSITDVPVIVNQAAASPNPTTTATTNLSVLAADPSYSESALTYTWSVTAMPSGVTSPGFSVNGTNAAKNTVVTFHAAGAYSFLVTVSDPAHHTVTSDTDVTVTRTLTSIVVSPTSQTVAAGDTQQFSAVGYDQFGVTMSGQTFVWTATIGEVSTSGLWTAPSTAGSGTVTATVGSVSASSDVTVGQRPVITQAAAATPNLTGTQTTALSVSATDDGGEESLTYAWTLSSKPTAAATPTFSANQSNAAKNCTATFSAAGNYTFLVTVTDEDGLTATSTIVVTVDQTLTAIVVSPAPTSVYAGQTKQFTATARDQFGTAMTTQPTFTWTTTAGTISSAGLLTAPNQLTTSQTVTASSESFSGVATFNVTSAAPIIAKIVVVQPRGLITWNICSTLGVKRTSLKIDGHSIAGAFGPHTAASGADYGCFFAGLAAGSHRYTIAATDRSGHVSTSTDTFTLANAVISHVVVLPSQGLITWNAYAIAGVQDTTLKVDGHLVAKQYGPHWTRAGFDYAGVIAALSAGSHAYTITAADGHGHSATANGTFCVTCSTPEASASKLQAIDSVFARSVWNDD
jgi:predicted outer membrane repeat protein